MKDRRALKVHVVVDLEVYEARGEEPQDEHRRKKDPKGIALVKLEYETEPVFGVVGNHGGRLGVCVKC